jgi:hypothetical protein
MCFFVLSAAAVRRPAGCATAGLQQGWVGDGGCADRAAAVVVCVHLCRRVWSCGLCLVLQMQLTPRLHRTVEVPASWGSSGRQCRCDRVLCTTLIIVMTQHQSSRSARLRFCCHIPVQCLRWGCLASLYGVLLPTRLVLYCTVLSCTARPLHQQSPPGRCQACRCSCWSPCGTSWTAHQLSCLPSACHKRCLGCLRGMSASWALWSVLRWRCGCRTGVLRACGVWLAASWRLGHASRGRR